MTLYCYNECKSYQHRPSGWYVQSKSHALAKEFGTFFVPVPNQIIQKSVIKGTTLYKMLQLQWRTLILI